MQRHPSTHVSQLARLANGTDNAAWFEFHARYGELIRSVCRRYGLQPAVCDDVLQESLIELMRAMSTFEYDAARGSFRGFLRQIVTRTAWRKLRQKYDDRSQHTDEGRLPWSESEQDELWEREWRRHHVRRAMRAIESEFTELNRLAFMMCVVHGRAAADAAKALGISIEQVYQAKSRIMRRLGAIVQQQVEEEG